MPTTDGGRRVGARRYGGMVTRALFRGIQDVARRNPTGDYHGLLAAFELGDITYGLNPRLSRAVEELTAVAISTTFKPIRGASAAYVARTLPADLFFMQADIVNQVFLHEAGEPYRYATDDELRGRSRAPERLLDFRDFIAHHPRYDAVGAPAGLSLWDRFRLTSKAGLEFQLLRRRPIHFIADTILESLGKVATKTGYEGTCITASEMRWLYRHRAMPLDRSYVRFWTATREIPHGEIFGHPAWASYAPKNTYRGDWEKVPAARGRDASP